MTATATTMPGSIKGPAVGRRRLPQPKSIARKLSGRFGAKLAALSDSSGVTVDELAKRLGKTPEAVRHYFRGRSIPHMDEWPAIAKALGLKHWREILPD